MIAATAGDKAEIEQAVKTYLDGMYEGDTEKLANVFLPTSALSSIQDGKVTVMPRENWFEAVRNRESPKKRGLTRHEEIVTIDFADGVTGMAKVKCAVPPRFFVDYLLFLKVDGKWKVAQKTFSIETRN